MGGGSSSGVAQPSGEPIVNYQEVQANGLMMRSADGMYSMVGETHFTSSTFEKGFRLFSHSDAAKSAWRVAVSGGVAHKVTGIEGNVYWVWEDVVATKVYLPTRWYGDARVYWPMAELTVDETEFSDASSKEIAPPSVFRVVTTPTKITYEFRWYLNGGRLKAKDGLPLYVEVIKPSGGTAYVAATNAKLNLENSADDDDEEAPLPGLVVDATSDPAEKEDEDIDPPIEGL